MDGRKRLEIRMLVDGGRLSLESPTLGRFEHDGVQEKCFYVDVKPGSEHEFVLDSAEAERGLGLAPEVHLAEYGPAGPYWYDIINIACSGAGDPRCNREGAAAFGQGWMTSRKRGRLDPCGSTVVTGLKWDTPPAHAGQDGGRVPGFRVQFVLHVKSFATQFAPGSTECVPK